MSQISTSFRLLRARRNPISLNRAANRPSLARNPLLFHGSRNASTTTEAGAADARSLVTRLKNLLWGTSITLSLVFGYIYITDTRASAHQWLVVPSVRWLFPDAEDAHHTGTAILKRLYALGLHPRERNPRSPAQEIDISIEVFGQKLQNPIGTSAGIDKLAEVPDALFAMGPAIVEVGGTTPLPQDGNPKPRVFRLPDRSSMINRYGLNSLGADDMARRLRERVRLFAHRNGYGTDGERSILNGEAGIPPGSLQEGKLLLVQVAKNKDTKDGDIDAVRRDYVYCVDRLAPYADILVVNVSSPNTPGLRSLQQVEPLTKILDGVVGAARAVKRTNAPSPKVMVKVSPDEDQDEQIEGIVEAIWRSGVDGIIVGNTTNRRALPTSPKLSAKEIETLNEKGGLSGPHMFERTLSLVKRYRKLLDEGPPSSSSSSPPPPPPPPPSSSIPSPLSSTEEGQNNPATATATTATTPTAAPTRSSHPQQQKVIFASGGITNGKQALEILNAGASVAQIYTTLIYNGAGTVTRMKREMREELRNSKK